MLSVNKINQLRHNFWFLWFLILTVVFLIHCLTLAVSPPIWQDEVQIIEYGRTFLNPHTDWSINWDVANNRPYLTLSYLGCLVQELVFKATHFSIFGPRIFSLIGASLAATTATGWLLSRKVPVRVAGLLGLNFLLDPFFVRSYLHNRIDCWAIALCLAACWLLKLSLQRFHNDKFCLISVSLAGSLSAIAFFVWPSATIIYPLILLELWSLLYAIIKEEGNLKKCLYLLLGFILTGIMTSMFLLIPVKYQLGILVNNLLESANNRVESFSIDSIINLVKNFLRNPILAILALLGLTYSRDKWLALTTLFALSLVSVTISYTARILYLLPYLIALVSEIYCEQKSKNIKVLNPQVKSGFLILLLSWSIAFSLIVRPVVIGHNMEGINSNILLNEGFSSIGKGEYKVWDSTWRFYQVGRLLGWKLYQPFFEINEEELREFINQMDYIISQEVEISGFKLSKEIKLIDDGQKTQGLLSNAIALFDTEFFQSQKHSKAYKLYTRQK
jgi:hypothetical protein